MKGIILAGGTSSRLYPATLSTSKQLLPIYDKPLIYYPLSTLMLAGLRDILIITTPSDQALFKKMLGNGEQWGIKLSYLSQTEPRGIADAFVLAESFIEDDTVCLILGDNILYGDGLAKQLQACTQLSSGADIFAYYVNDPERYGVVAFDKMGQVVDIVEKPITPPSHYAVIGLYFYDKRVVDFAKSLKPSARGELEITDINRYYLQEQTLRLHKLNRGMAWLDTGTPSSLLDAANFIHVLECRQGLKIACLEEIAWRQGYISNEALQQLAQPLSKSDYGRYLLNLAREHENYSH